MPADKGRQGRFPGVLSDTPPERLRHLTARLRHQVYRRAVRNVARIPQTGGRRPRSAPGGGVSTGEPLTAPWAASRNGAPAPKSSRMVTHYSAAVAAEQDAVATYL